MTMPEITRFADVLALAAALKTTPAFGIGCVPSSRYAATFALQEPLALQVNEKPFKFMRTSKLLVVDVVTVAVWKQQKTPLLSPSVPLVTPAAVGPGGP